MVESPVYAIIALAILITSIPILVIGLAYEVRKDRRAGKSWWAIVKEYL